MGMQLQSGEQVVLTGTTVFTGAYNDTQGSHAMSGDPETDIITLVLSNADANFKFLQLKGNGYYYGSSPFTCEIYLTAENNHIGPATSIRANIESPGCPFSIERTLVAGVDYVQGVGFTVKIRAFQTAGGGGVTIYGNYLAVEGVV